MTTFGNTIFSFYDTNQQRIIYDFVDSEELCIFANYRHQLCSILRTDLQRLTIISEIVVFLCCIRMRASRWSTITGTLYVESLHNSLCSVKHIRHYDKVTLTNDFSIAILLNQFVQTKELRDERTGILFQIIVIVFEYLS